MQKEKKTIEISETLYESLNQSSDDSGFESIEEFVNFVLEEVIRRGVREESKLTNDEQKEIDKSLKALGYISEKDS
jgi:hypothetical protein